MRWESKGAKTPGALAVATTAPGTGTTKSLGIAEGSGNGLGSCRIIGRDRKESRWRKGQT